ncbi:MAG: hypothetical protein K8S56_04300 [Candidatus Cloacimonetes bacterium]|nr:hypothetical protein [Candidatus Cloacimonadota bacterium]
MHTTVQVYPVKWIIWIVAGIPRNQQNHTSTARIRPAVFYELTLTGLYRENVHWQNLLWQCLREIGWHWEC